MAEKGFLEQYGVTNNQGLFIVALIIYFVYLNQATQPVPNVINNTIMYGVDSSAPPTYVTGTQVGIGWLLIAFLVGSFWIKETKGQRVSERKFKEFLVKEILQKQNIPLPDGKKELPEGNFHIDKNIITQDVVMGDKREILKLWAQVIIIDDDGDENYYIISGNPFSLMIEDIIETHIPLNLDDKFVGGRAPDREVILSKDLEKYKVMKKALSSD